MRKIVGWVAVGLGVFVLVAGLIADVWAEDQLKRTPLDVDSVTRLDGTAARIDTENGGLDLLDVRATSFTRSDSEASDDDVVVFVSNTCLVVDVPGTPDCGQRGTGDDADPNVINVSEPVVFATDRRTAEAVQDPEYVPEGAPDTEGLVNKWPFDAQQQDYEVWDGLLGEAVTATFEGEEELEGLPVYRYQYELIDESAEVLEGTFGLYSQLKTYWIEPVTGSIIRQEQSEVRALEDGTVLLDLDIAFTDDQVAANVADAEDSRDGLNLLTSTVPTIGYAVGIPLVLVGLVLLLLSGRRRQARAHEAEKVKNPTVPTR
ncbi:DUF3068 domain-containing protein [Nocardioides coralli]|uniref:DUF3068 domain-containing protein n=1 Tax=Nocardioides coralli TaxID=2872154 RepID=UPI001CA43791|nr:DUF3068 domain-containing protein [Nocardioides coralli]QZY27899.1 DUF3068 domain-containing protein [Nocardioides coralli]